MGASGEGVADEDGVVARDVETAVALVRDSDPVEAAAAVEVETRLAHPRVARLGEAQAIVRA
jgi:hypothetical protein